MDKNDQKQREYCYIGLEKKGNLMLLLKLEIHNRYFEPLKPFHVNSNNFGEGGSLQMLNAF